MSLLSSRMRFLIAMGLPAGATSIGCSASKADDVPPMQPPVPSSDGTSASNGNENPVPPMVTIGPLTPEPTPEPSATASTESAPALPPRALCLQDEVREQMCGIPAGSTAECASDGSHLGAYNGRSWRVLDGTMTANNPAFKSFPFDAHATETWRRTNAAKAEASSKPTCCYSRCTPIAVTTAAPDPGPQPPRGPVGPFFMRHNRKCTSQFEAGTSRPATNAPQCAQAITFKGEVMSFERTAEDKCCYDQRRWVERPRPRRMRGRPLRVAGEAVTANVRDGDTWANVTPSRAPALSPFLQQQLHDAWVAEAQLEHASVAAFAMLALQLTALGASADLVDDALAAARDEVSHARISFSWAAHFGNRASMPAPLPMVGDGRIDVDWRTLLQETISDGCVGETIAAEEARRAASVAVDAKMATQLNTIADDEQRHAELGWRVAAWLVREHGAPAIDCVREWAATLETELAGSSPGQSPGPLRDGCCTRPTEPHGILCDHQRAEVRREVLAGVVLPCLQALAASIS